MFGEPDSSHARRPAVTPMSLAWTNRSGSYPATVTWALLAVSRCASLLPFTLVVLVTKSLTRRGVSASSRWPSASASASKNGADTQSSSTSASASVTAATSWVSDRDVEVMQQRRRHHRCESGRGRDAPFEVLESFGKDGVTDQTDQASHPCPPRGYGGVAHCACPTGKW